MKKYCKHNVESLIKHLSALDPETLIVTQTGNLVYEFGVTIFEDELDVNGPNIEPPSENNDSRGYKRIPCIVIDGRN